MEKIAYFNQPNCYKLSNGTVEVIVTTDIGPRIIRYGFQGEENLLAEVPDLKVTTELGDWKASKRSGLFSQWSPRQEFRRR